MLSPGETTGMMAKAPLIANFPAHPAAPGKDIHAHAYTKDEETAIIITAYQPNPDRWIDFERRKK